MRGLLRSIRAVSLVMLAVLIVAGVGALLASAVSQGQQAPVYRCDEAERMGQRLEQGYGEHLVLIAHIPEGQGRPPGVLQIFANPETRTWSAVTTTPDLRNEGGLVSCLALAGTGWTHLRPVD